MNKNKTVFLLTVIASLLIIALPTIIKIYQGHQARLYEVATKKILESAEECFRDQICTGNKVTVLELKEAGYLKGDVVNPKTRTYFEDSMVLYVQDFKASLET